MLLRNLIFQILFFYLFFVVNRFPTKNCVLNLLNQYYHHLRRRKRNVTTIPHPKMMTSAPVTVVARPNLIARAVERLQKRMRHDVTVRHRTIDEESRETLSRQHHRQRKQRDVRDILLVANKAIVID